MKMSRIAVNDYLQVAFGSLILFFRSGRIIMVYGNLTCVAKLPRFLNDFAIRVSVYAAFVIPRNISRDVTGRTRYFSPDT